MLDRIGMKAQSPDNRWLELATKTPACLLMLVVLLAVSLRLFLVFTPSEMDSFWLYSWAVNLVDHGIRADVFFNPLDRVGGTYIFQMIPTAVVAAIYLLMGHGFWTIFVANLVWLLIILAAFYYFLRCEFRYSPVVAIGFGAALCLMEPVLRGVVSLRAETLALAMTLVALVIARKGQWVWLAGILAVLAVETHATGVVGASFIGLRVLLDRPDRRTLALLVLGGVIGLMIFWALHPGILSLQWLGDLGERQGNNGIRSPLAAYFWHAQYKRHLPELVFIAVALWVMGRGHSIGQVWALTREEILQVLLAACLLELLGRGSYLYVVWIFVPFYVMALRLAPLALLPLLAFHLASYFALMAYNGDYSHLRLASTIRSLAVPNMLVMGPHPAFVGAPTPAQFVWLPDVAEIPGTIDVASRPVLIVSGIQRPNVHVDKKVGGFYLGWLQSPAPR